MSAPLVDLYADRVARGQLKADPVQMAALEALEPVRGWLEATSHKRGFLDGLLHRAPERPRGAYLWGGVGRGKSMLMDLFHEATDIRRKRRVHFHAFMQEMQAGLHAARQTHAADALKPVAEKVIAEVRLLCFDEMQITDIADAMIVGRLFERLFDAGVIVVATSNRPPHDLYENGLNRALFEPFIALLEDNMDVRELAAAGDYRQDRLRGAAVFFTPANAEARRAIEAIWADLSGGAASPLTLHVNGRDVVLPAVRNGAGRASFWELCAKPLGPADYLAIAGALRVLVLEDIPRLSAANYNEAKRFVTLVDALYEGRVRLIASAADAPESLYLEGTGSFEYARTASRLREMQSEGWGS